MRVERFKMEREGLVTEGQEVEISQEREKYRKSNRQTEDFIC